MNDETITMVVLVATLGTFVFMAVQFKLRQARGQHPLGDVYRPAPKHQTRPGATD